MRFLGEFQYDQVIVLGRVVDRSIGGVRVENDNARFAGLLRGDSRDEQVGDGALADSLFTNKMNNHCHV